MEKKEWKISLTKSNTALHAEKSGAALVAALFDVVGLKEMKNETIFRYRI